MTAGQGPAFTIPSSKWLRSRHVQGEATVRLMADGLEVSGASGGLLRISTAQIRQVRSGWSAIKYGPLLQTRVWLHEEDEPLKLEHRGLGFAPYAAVVQGLAAQLARVDGVSRLHRGSSIASAVELLVPMTVLFLAALAISVFVLENEPWWGRPIPALVALTFVIVGAVLAFQRWPRPVRTIDEFNQRIAPSLQRPRNNKP